MPDEQAIKAQIESTHRTRFEVRPISPDDLAWVKDALTRYWASTLIVSRGRTHKADELPGFIAWRGDTPVGLLVYEIRDDHCEIVTHNSLAGHGGVGSVLLAAVRQAARDAGCSRLWLTTCNDNTPALRFYQRRDFDIAAIHHGAATQARKIKPAIPQIGLDGIPIKHEIEMEYTL